MMLGAASAASATTTGPTITTIAGGVGGPDPGTQVAIDPTAVTASGSSVFLSAGGAIWRLNESNDWLTPVAGVGTGAPGQSGNGLIADAGNNEIRVLAVKTGTFYGVAMTAGDIYRIAGSTAAQFSGDGGPAISAGIYDPADVAAGPDGTILVAGDNRVRLITG
jgi:hypothetical protein